MSMTEKILYKYINITIWLTLALMLAILPAFAGQQSPPHLLPAVNADYVIGPGDQIDIRVFGQAEMSGRFRVSELGFVNIPFIGKMQATGLSEETMSDAIRIALTKVIRDPEVSVIVAEFQSKMVTIIGAVKTAGRYPLRRSERVLDIVGQAGGLIETAGKSILLFRHTPVLGQPEVGQELTENSIEMVTLQLDDLVAGDPKINRLVQDGDLISVPLADTIYVTGNVNKPGAFNPKDDVTLTQAIALAGGLTPTAQGNNIILLRNKPGSIEREELKFNLRDLEKRKVVDPILGANDVVYVRGSESRSIGLAFLRALTTGLGSAAGFAVFR